MEICHLSTCVIENRSRWLQVWQVSCFLQLQLRRHISHLLLSFEAWSTGAVTCNGTTSCIMQTKTLLLTPVTKETLITWFFTRLSLPPRGTGTCPCAGITLGSIHAITVILAMWSPLMGRTFWN